MTEHFYPAIFTREDTGFSVRFPDVEGCFAEGDSVEEAYKDAQSALGLFFQQQDGAFSFPSASAPDQHMRELDEGESLVLVRFDELEYRRQHDNAAVKKTLTIPSWLDYEAKRAQAPFSKILQAGLMEYLGKAEDEGTQFPRASVQPGK
ncbi:MAG: type II toxin-antitoxin system HicB family antitoxin [Coriobacteriales bacterium]|nr:type II toxin-antitoxin system HicB family antitoxin [Coriobacteriales bacterium]